MADDNTGGAGERTFTQADVNRLLAEERRRTEQRFGDYDQLKKDAENTRRTADAQKSDIDKLTDSVRALTERAAKSEATIARRDAAEKHKLPSSFAKKLPATSAEDADREAKELADELRALGVKLGDAAGAGEGAGSGEGENGKTTGGDAGKTGAAGSNGTGGDAGKGNDGAGIVPRGRPKEDLRSGTAGAGGSGEQNEDVSKIADSLFARQF